MRYIDSEKLIAEIERYKQGAAIARFDNAGENADYFQGKVDLCDDLTHIITSLQREQQEVDYNIIPLPEERMASYIAYCLGREDDDCICPTCGKHVTGLRLFPYYYDRDNNDVYFASVCPECGKIIISKE